MEKLLENTQVVVLMGGLGTRLGLKNVPKAMADVNGIPFFDYQLRILKRWGFQKFLFLVGYQASMIEDYYGDGSRFQVQIVYSYDGKEQMGTGGALKNAYGMLEEEFILIYGDSFMDIDYRELVYRYYAVENPEIKGIMAILHNSNNFDKSNVIYEDGVLVLYDKSVDNQRMEYIDYGVSLLSKSVLDDVSLNFDIAEVLTKLSITGKLLAQVTTKRFYEIGKPSSLEEFRVYAKGRFDTVQRAVFFDRDGVINELYFNDDTEQLDSPFRKEEFVYKKGIIETLRKIQDSNYYVFIVTNQPAAAKGKVALEALYDLNTWIIQDLAKKGIDVEFVALCPHHPTGSKKTRNHFLIQDCKCRKPKAALLTDLYSVYSLDLENSFMVGDSYTDIIAGKKAGVRTILLGDMKCDMCQKLLENYPDFIVDDISGIVKIITGGK